MLTRTAPLILEFLTTTPIVEICNGTQLMIFELMTVPAVVIVQGPV